MFNNKYSNLCCHNKIKRIDDNFIKCLQCGIILVNQKIIVPNKNINDFIKENNCNYKNFDRNFNNIVDINN